jgi:predicted lipoprotein with Yx(FWY)xxD motif
MMVKKFFIMFCAALLLLCAGCTQSPQTVSNNTSVTSVTPAANVTPAVNNTVQPVANVTPPVNVTPVAPTQVTVSTASNPELGTILVDGNGMTLYVFNNDAINTSSCAGKCLLIWPPVSGNAVGQGLTGTLGTIQRADGSTQATYNGMPLYYYSADQKAGDVNGQGILGVWFAAQPGMSFFPRAMTVSEAESMSISDCLSVGNLTNVSMYNNVTDTWWINLDTVKSGCSPACVIDENLTGTVNWRCTGLLTNQTMNQAINQTVRPVLETYNSTQYGQILTSSSGYALYVYSDDTLNTPTCLYTCRSAWPPLVLSEGYTTDVSGLPGKLATVIRPDGLTQVTYNGMPLYLDSFDGQPDVVTGDGADALWHVVTTNMTTFPPKPPPIRSNYKD